ncbi:MAG TPA: hypothetical protein VFK38_09195 [Candidatus Limnocylindrales bacterium]|nr:hypothetical protein [Candidatus Limnocylindrales bacterium]
MRQVWRLGWLLVAVGAWLAAVAPATACSCFPTTIRDYLDDEQAAVFIGTALPQTGDNVPVVVQGWFKGPGEAPIVLTETGEVHDPVTGTVGGNTCGVKLTGGPFIVVAHFRGPGQPLQPSSCSPYAWLSMPDGQKLLAEAVSIFGEPKPPGEPPSAAPATATATPAPATTSPPPTHAPSAGPADDAEQARASAATTLLLGTGLATLAVFGLVWLLARARPRS